MDKAKISKKKICFAATVPDVILAFLGEHIRACALEMSVHLVSSANKADLLKNMPANFEPMPIERKPSIWRDCLSFVMLMLFFHRQKFDIVHSIMPKTGLLAMMAARLVGVPCRVHTFTGQIWVNKRGLKRWSLKIIDRAIVFFSTHILIDSPSQRDFLLNEKILYKKNFYVLGYGSICGVDMTRFHPNSVAKSEVKAELGINPRDIVLLYLGRLTRDKGIFELSQAFRTLARQMPNLVLILVGAEDEITFSQMQIWCEDTASQLRRVDFTTTPERYMASADILCLPSYREGFGQVIIEAAACGVPTVASQIYGITDAIEDGVSGVLCPVGDIPALTQALSIYIKDSMARSIMSLAAVDRVSRLFTSQYLVAEQQFFYRKILNNT